MTVFCGCYTAIITPMKPNQDVDYKGLQRLVEFQVEQGVCGIVACGTTGESPTLSWNEHNLVTKRVHDYLDDRATTIAGTGSNSTREMLRATEQAYDFGIKAVLLVDPYYNGPSSREIRLEYVEPVAKRFPEVQAIPYIIPGRTGTQLLPQDLAILHSQYDNVRAVKEATGNIENMKLIRKLCGADFDILSGDDDITFDMMTTTNILASGVVSVASNVFPSAVQRMVQCINEKRIEEASRLNETLKPMFETITVKTQEDTPYGPVLCKARNPLAYKTLMNVLGMPAGPCRPPLGKMTTKGIKIVLDAARAVYNRNPELFRSLEDFFDVDLNKRLHDEKYWEKLTHD